MYPQMNRRAKDLVLYFYQKHFPDKDGLVWPIEPMKIETDFNELHNLFDGHNYKEDYQILTHSVRALGSTVPPMINAYISLSPTMRSFGTAMNTEFGNTDETGILVTLRDIVPEKRKRYIESYDTKNRCVRPAAPVPHQYEEAALVETDERDGEDRVDPPEETEGGLQG